ncbi:uncharacterized protein LOC133800213 [Humulus lupulus]|uniref:uncharacterized protein LOC133800213 n=1 Tax=Humulus lupulus TaxID=3486 RepID=UPI002B40B6E0|nr:uncharacterized protein LOC133800213 [Humulus lupulus]
MAANQGNAVNNAANNAQGAATIAEVPVVQRPMTQRDYVPPIVTGLQQNSIAAQAMQVQAICNNCGGPHQFEQCMAAEQGNLPSNIVVKPKEQCNAIFLRSGKELEEFYFLRWCYLTLPQQHSLVSFEHHIKIPYPQRLQKNKLDKQFSKILDVFRKLHINIPLAEAFEQLSSYVNFMKESLSKKWKLEDYEIVVLIEECSTILQKKLPPKLEDPGSFITPCTTGNVDSEKALCDLGACMTLMPLFLYRKLKLGEALPTTMSLKLADHSIKYPRGVIEDVLVKVAKFIFPTDLIILDIKKDENIFIILGRPFLATGRALIGVQKRELKMHVQQDKVTFNVFAATEIPT